MNRVIDKNEDGYIFYNKKIRCVRVDTLEQKGEANYLSGELEGKPRRQLYICCEPLNIGVIGQI